MLDISRNVANGEMLLKIKGNIDTATAPQLNDVIKEDIDLVDKVILDFSEVEYISSAGLRVLLLAQKTLEQKGGDADNLIIKSPTQEVKDVFEVTRFSDFLHIED